METSFKKGKAICGLLALAMLAASPGYCVFVNLANNFISFTYQQGSSVPAPINIPLTSVNGSFNVSIATNPTGWLVVSPTQGSGTTVLLVSVSPQNLAVGNYVGVITIKDAGLTNSTAMVQVSLGVKQGQPPVVPPTPPVVPPTPPVISSVTNAASFLQSSLSPGMAFTVFGSNLGPQDITPADPAPVSQEIGGVRVFISGKPAQLLYVSKGLVSGVVPYGVSLGPQTLVVQRDTASSAPRNINVSATAPALFSLDSSGFGQAAALNQDSTLNLRSAPAERGSIIVLYATGEGATVPDGRDGVIATDVLPKPRLPVSVQIGSSFLGTTEAEVLYAGAAPGLVAGIMQVNARIPLNALIGNTPVFVTVGSTQSSPGVFISVKTKEPRANLEISFTPNPIVLPPTGIANFKVTLHETNGVGVALYELVVNSESFTDLLTSFDPRHIPPNGTAQGNFILTCPCTPGILVWNLSGIDDNGNSGEWTARVAEANQ